MKEAIQNINSKIAELNLFNKSLGLAEKIEREGSFFPAINKGNGEFDSIDLDKEGSVSYWRRNGEVNYTSQENTTNIGQEYRKDVPLKFVGFIKNTNTDQYFIDKVVDSIISVVTSNALEVRKALKVKRASIAATKSITNKMDVEKEEYDRTVDSIRYQDCYFSIDFTLSVFTNSQCYKSLCNDC